LGISNHTSKNVDGKSELSYFSLFDVNFLKNKSMFVSIHPINYIFGLQKLKIFK